MAAFIAAQGEQYEVSHATGCRALQVSPAWFYKWRDGDASPRHARRVALAAEVARRFAGHHGKYGSPRITADLREAGWRVSENAVATLMRERGLVARAKRRRKSTTASATPGCLHQRTANRSCHQHAEQLPVSAGPASPPSASTEWLQWRVHNVTNPQPAGLPRFRSRIG